MVIYIYITIKIDALPIKMNSCQGLINYVLICQLPSLQGNYNNSDQSSIIPGLSISSFLNPVQLRTLSAFNLANLLA